MKKKIRPSKSVGIVGLGLIGGSLGLDLQKLGWKVYGIANNSSNANRAKDRMLAEIVSINLTTLGKCDLIILALPLNELLKPTQELISALPKDAVITDVGSVKEPIINVWKNLHPRFIGSHPMAGTTKAGVEAGQRDLFKNRPWVATPEKDSDLEALQVIQELAISLGSKWITSTATNHDQAVSLISHLPLLVSAALLKSIKEETNSTVLSLAKDLASSGFADTTRVGGGNPKLGTAIMANNSSPLLEALNSYKVSLNELEKLITNATLYLECWMTVAKIKQLIAKEGNRKAFFSEFQ